MVEHRAVCSWADKRGVEDFLALGLVSETVGDRAEQELQAC